MTAHLTQAISRKSAAMERAVAEMNRSAAEIVARRVDEEAASYRRSRDLPRLLGPKAARLTDPVDVLELLRTALQRAQASAHRGNFFRCIELRGAILAEERALAGQQDIAA